MSDHIQRIVELSKFIASKHTKGVELSSGPLFETEGESFFNSIIPNISTYLEYGSGGSTILASKYVDTLVSVEHDSVYVATVKKQILNKDANIIHVNIGITGQWGYPIIKTLTPSRLARWKRYVTVPWEYLNRRKITPQLILIDGRFRVACFLQSLLNVTSDCTILIDDYFDREYYKPVEQFAEIVSRHGRMARFRKRIDFDIESCMRALESFYADYR